MATWTDRALFAVKAERNSVRAFFVANESRDAYTARVVREMGGLTMARVDMARSAWARMEARARYLDCVLDHLYARAEDIRAGRRVYYVCSSSWRKSMLAQQGRQPPRPLSQCR